MEDLINACSKVSEIRFKLLSSEAIDNIKRDELASDYVNLAVASLNQVESYLRLASKLVK